MNKTEPHVTTQAIALKYDDAAPPTVTAKGDGELAQQILELAKIHDIPLYDDPQLVELLARIPLGDEIPEALYRAVAEVIAFAFMVSGKIPEPLRQRHNKSGDY